jgi:hypothetical protein
MTATGSGRRAAQRPDPEDDEHDRARQAQRGEGALGGRDERRDPERRGQRPRREAACVPGHRDERPAPAAARSRAHDERRRGPRGHREQRRERDEGLERAQHARIIAPRG